MLVTENIIKTQDDGLTLVNFLVILCCAFWRTFWTICKFKRFCIKLS